MQQQFYHVEKNEKNVIIIVTFLYKNTLMWVKGVRIWTT